MQIQKSVNHSLPFGTLYLVPTPIGNLQDMTFRAIETLKTVDLIAAEDTRNTGLLLKHFEIETHQISFHEHNAYEKIPVLLEMLRSGQSIAQVSDAGLPSISDPGHDLVQAVIAENIPVVALPGASAGITALIASGLAPQPHIFYGFLPRKAGQQKAFFEEKKHYSETQIFYESPHRVKATLENMQAVYGDRSVVVVRELTKLYEEYQRGHISELLAFIAAHPLKGECLMIVSGAEKTEACEADEVDLKAAVEALIEAGSKPNQAIKEVAKRYQLKKQEVYDVYHELRYEGVKKRQKIRKHDEEA
ncbi:16S rRNA (cytidine(1402)-2'-O)-methyltransferase [Streptococcus cuniculi]|uniref:Ribosomal RNA small subunit methyltransferase I n=1 Tax=Streptococcus cuniculi TaxID=1432788 RepID=A0A4Y9JB49_9STRE|nr:16S rRNA (cytidine(1402)-2'-O)-methyltransferase [Streptococcus cuniculi]MBF0778038.1 16S rRNA (cytidine(1402)-2'-O)-methyltransferase [Streptococcus cuniculi]TFU98047.1 16S rRNA (cytidine(1402)-2'-O)-methyltransferase [Streptococcus cuniculi]